MKVQAVDERDSWWENNRPRFRVYLFDSGSEQHAWNTATYDVTDADIVDVINWARTEAGADRLFAVALVTDDAERAAGERQGLTWLLGGDINDHPRDDSLARAVARMRAMRPRNR